MVRVVAGVLPATLVPPGGIERFESCQQKRERLLHTGAHVPDISKERSYEAFLHATGRWHSCDRRGC